LRKEGNINGMKQSFLFSGSGNEHVLFIHGNGSSSVFWDSVLQAMPDGFKCIAPDLRGYGQSESIPAKAERSYGDYVDDLINLIRFLDVSEYHVVAHSLGGGIAWELLCRNSVSIKSMVLINPASPFGFGGTKNENGHLTYPGGEGSGGGIVNPDFVKLLIKKDRTEEHEASPLNVMNQFYWNPPFKPENTPDLLEALLAMKVGDQFYPGDSKPSDHFPFSSPGDFGQLNCASPLTKTSINEQLVALEYKPPILWVRGGKDQIVSNQSMFDLATHGIAGLIPGYPGEDEFPQQPMLDQTRYVLKNYAENGGDYKEMVFSESGHSPFIEEEARLMSVLSQWLTNLK
jgi:pimeloyl-ACP methyl ester carboxylesterase